MYIYTHTHTYIHTYIYKSRANETFILVSKWKSSANEKTTYRMRENIAKDAADKDLILKIHKQLI